MATENPLAPEALLVSQRTAAQLLDVHLNTVKRLVADGKIGTLKLRGRTMIKYDELRRLVDSLPAA